MEGIHCILDSTEYDLHSKSNLSLFDEAHTQLLDQQWNIGWEYLLKGFLAQDWRELQGQYYRHRQLNPRNFSSSGWVVNVLLQLHNFRQSMWHLRNAAIHGDPTEISGKVFRQKLV
jgi:uncharacterized GH25 family protein